MINEFASMSSIRGIKRINIGSDVKVLMNDAIETTSRTRKEVGLWVCGNKIDDVIQFNNGMLTSSSGFDARSFRFNSHNIPSIERSICRNDDVLLGLMHTHPDGNHFPSGQDRKISNDMDMIGCVIGSVRTSCFYGNDDIPVR